MVFKEFPHILFILSVLIILGLGYFYFFMISPAFVVAPHIEKPSGVISEEVTSDELIYLLNEIGAYKLHNNPLGGEYPVIEVLVEDSVQDFYFQVTDNEIIEIPESHAPDIKLALDRKIISDIIDSPDSLQQILKHFSSGKITITPLQDEKVLALKGYKCIYDQFSSVAGITGNIILKLKAKTMTGGINMGILLLTSLIIGLIIEKEI